MPTQAQEQITPGRIQTVSSTTFATNQQEPTERFEAWRQSIGVIFEVEPEGKAPSPRFSASVRTYHLGDMLISGTSFGDQIFKRDRRRISSDGLDHYLVQLYHDGGLVGETRRREMNVRAGDIQIVDLAQPHTSIARGSATIVMTVPREVLSEMLPPSADLHGVVLRGDRGAGGLLADYMKSLFSRLESVEAAQAPAIARVTIEMVAACSYPTADTAARARAPIEGVVLDRIKRYIDENLGSRELSPHSLSQRFRVSRSQLYRMFEPVGGVAGYIQTRRLDCAFAQLRNPLQRHRRIFEIAFDSGFSSISHFNAAFRRQFGVSPGELRETLGQAIPHNKVTAIQSRAEVGYEDWIRGLAQRSPIRVQRV
jgi:AraC-like DNA-binding protein